jgi:hypothetical protein
MERDNRPLVIALGGALAFALLAIAFLLGRITSSPAVVTVSAPVSSVVKPESRPSALEREPTSIEIAVAPAPEAALTQVPAPPPGLSPPGTEVAPTSAAAAPTGLAAPRSADRQQIAAYFNQIDRLEDVGTGDPQAFANSMLQSMTSGDYSGFDDLLTKAKTQRQRLLSIPAPSACVEHHRLAMALSADSVAMLERLKNALIKGDSTGLMTIATEGRTLEAQANQLKSMGDKIKRQAGL